MAIYYFRFQASYFLTTLFIGSNDDGYFENKKKIIIIRLKADAGHCDVTLYIIINRNVNTNN